MQEKNLPTPVAPDGIINQNPEISTSATGEIINTPTPMTPEKKVSVGDQVNQSDPVQQVVVPADLPRPVSTAVVATSDNSTVTANSNPAVADDVDVIEKVWVQKAKSIISQTKADPYQQEEKVSKLQTDYQLKRFGEAAADK